MKKKQVKKLNLKLNKVQIAKLNNFKAVDGGTQFIVGGNYSYNQAICPTVDIPPIQ